MLKLISKVILIIIAILVLVLLYLYFIPPPQQEYTYEYILEDTPGEIDDKIGWYSDNGGKDYQVTWNARRGLQLNYFDEQRKNIKSMFLTPISLNVFDTDGDTTSKEAVFSMDPVDSTMQVSVNTSKSEIEATKVDSLYYYQDEVEFYNGDIRLKGLLLIPFNKSSNTAIVMIHGSGVSDRNNFWYMYQADYLAKKGYTVLLPDKRGCGKSMGEWHNASFDDFAGDAIAAVEYLKKEKPRDAQKIALLGLSQGGWISQLAGQRSDHIDYIMDVVSSATTPNEQVLHEIKNDINNMGFPSFVSSVLAPIFVKRAMAKRKVWWKMNGGFDPLQLMIASNKPILKIYGREDEYNNVPVHRSEVLLNDMIQQHKKNNITVKIYEESSHGLMHPSTGWIRSDYLEGLVSWLNSQE